MSALNNDVLSTLLNNGERPCLSLYLTTHRTQPERRDDLTRYRALVRQLETSLERAYEPSRIERMLKPFHDLQNDEDFWNSRRAGIAVFSSPHLHLSYHLDRPVSDVAIVANSFHLKPLLRLLQTVERYHVLTLTKERISLFVGDRDGLSAVELHPEVPQTMTDALGEHETHRETTVASSGGARRMHGHQTAQEQHDLDTERFFRAVDRAINHHYSQPSGLPLIVVGVPDQVSVFHRVRKNPHVLLEAVTAHPESLSVADLTTRTWQIMEPYAARHTQQLIDSFHEASAHGKGLSTPTEVAKAVVEGRVDTLMVESGRTLPGVVNATTGDVAFDDVNEPDVDDLLDDLAELALRHKGKVLVLDAEQMPTTTGLAAILRY